MSTFACLRFADRCAGVLGALLATVALAASADAQTNVQWVTFKHVPTKLDISPSALSSGDTEVDLDSGDLNKDGWLDVIAFRKEQSSTVGKRAQTLLMNNHGRFEDKTALYASAADVVGDMGFLTPTNTRDGKIIDLNGDTWPDVVTCPTLSDGDPKHISHPRVYINLGVDGSGNWLGLRFENARIPQFLTIPGGVPVAPRFCEVAAGDVTGEGSPDLYFIDYDDTETGIGENPAHDLNDRLLVNDGNGYFTDSLETRMSKSQLQSAFGVKAEILDLNGDTRQDIVKLSTLGGNGTSAIYNQPLGSFQALGSQVFGNGSPYGFDMGNLNNDGLPDLAGADDGNDVYRLATGIDPLGKLTFGPLKTYQFVTGGDDGFGHNVHIQDLNGDGWSDVAISSVDVDFTGCGGRMHIYHNLGGVVGGDVTLREESELANGGTGSGWKGVVGITSADLAGSYDIVFGDFDHDTDIDFLMGVCSGTRYWQSQVAPDVCQTNIGFAGPGNAVLSMCGENLTLTASTALLKLTNAAPSSPIFIAVGLANNPTPLKGGTLVPMPILALISGFSTSGLGSFQMPIPGGSSTPLTLYMQCIVKNGAALEFSNALAVNLGL